MSRIVNLKTIRFQIFNVIDSWHTNWTDDYNYSHLLYEDLGIRSFFNGIFYRLKIPTNYIYINRTLNNQLILSTDLYFYKPINKTNLKKYYMEQRKYIIYILKQYVYLLPYVVQSLSSNLYHFSRKKKQFYFNTRKLDQYKYMGYFRIRNFESDDLDFTLDLQDDSEFNIYLKLVFNNLVYFNKLLLNSSDKMRVPFVLKKRGKPSLFLSLLGDLYIRFSYLYYIECNEDNNVPFVHLLISGLSTRYISNVYTKRYMLSSINTFNGFFKLGKKYNPMHNILQHNLFVNNYASGNPLHLYRLVLKMYNYCFNRYYTNKKLKYKMYFKYISKIHNNFIYWFTFKIRNYLILFIYKLYIVLYQTRFKIKMRGRFKITSDLFLFLLEELNNTYFISKLFDKTYYSYINKISPRILNTGSRKYSFILFLNVIKSVSRKYYRRKRILPTIVRIPKRFLYTYLTRGFIRSIFSYMFRRINHAISMYTKKSVHILYTLFYLGNRYYPPILNAKVVCDYFVHMIHTKRSIRSCFYKVRQWQVENIQRRIYLEGQFFKTQLKGKSKLVLDHLSYKKYPVAGIRIECSGNLKKGTMARKFFYGDTIRDNFINSQKTPNDTFAADIDYYQSFAITRSSTIGVKVWVFFKTYIYDDHGNIKSVVMY